MNDGPLLERFIQRRDETAFEELMSLHGPMVLGACKRVLGDHHDAEEAFQATFLVLSVKAASIMPRNHVGNWLYGVAYRTALKIKGLRNLRRTREIHDANAPEPETCAQNRWVEIAPLIDHELNLLPETYRIPLVLCDLEGRNHKDVARELGCPEGTLSSRLMRARNLLAKRLGQRGFVMSIGAMTILITQNAASAAVPAAIMTPVIQAAPIFAAQQSVTLSSIAPHVTEIANGIVQSMFHSTIKHTALGLAMCAGIGFSAVGLLLTSVASEPNAGAPPAVVAAPMDDVTYHYSGTVIDEQGNPAAGATVWMFSIWKSMSEPLAVTDEQGKFEFTLKTSDFSDNAQPSAVKIATFIAAKEGHGYAANASIYFESTGQLLAEIPPAARSKLDGFWENPSNVLKLVADDAPVRGRILNAKGLPVVGAQITTFMVYSGTNGSLEAWEKAATHPDANWFTAGTNIRLDSCGASWKSLPQVPAVQTDAEGYFTLKCLGHERLANIVVKGPDIETAVLSVRSRPGATIKLAYERDQGGGDRLIDSHYPNEFTKKLGPSTPIEGVVRESKTGLPLPGVVVNAVRIASYPIGGSPQTSAIRTITDNDGRYRLEGLPMGENTIELIPPEGKECEEQSISVYTSPISKPKLQATKKSKTNANGKQTSSTGSTGSLRNSMSGRSMLVIILGIVALIGGLPLYIFASRGNGGDFLQAIFEKRRKILATSCVIVAVLLANDFYFSKSPVVTEIYAVVAAKSSGAGPTRPSQFEELHANLNRKPMEFIVPERCKGTLAVSAQNKVAQFDSGIFKINLESVVDDKNSKKLAEAVRLDPYGMGQAYFPLQLRLDPTSDAVAYESARRLCVMNEQGSETVLKNLSGHPIQGLPVWSHDGQWIICTDSNAASDLGAFPVPGSGTWKFARDGSSVTKLPFTKDTYVWDMSPDGRWYLLSKYHEDGHHFHLVGVNDNALSVPIKLEGYGFKPRFSRDGTRFFFVCSEAGNAHKIGMRTFGSSDKTATVGAKSTWVYGGQKDYVIMDFSCSADGEFLAVAAYDHSRLQPGTSAGGNLYLVKIADGSSIELKVNNGQIVWAVDLK